MMFAGHHTTSGTSAWMLIELLKHPEYLSQVVAELDEVYADGAEYSFGALRQMPKVENALKEHPKVFDELYVQLCAAGEVGGILDSILNRLAVYIEKNVKLKGQVKSAMIYPIAVIVIVLLMVFGLLDAAQSGDAGSA